jgi:cation transport ATPase
MCLLAFSRTLTANIGVAVGMNGTEVTKEASDRVSAERALSEEATVYLLDPADLTAKRSLLGACWFRN